MEKEVNLENMNKIIENIVSSIKSGQDEMFCIYESVKEETEKIELELSELKEKVKIIINEVSILEKEEKRFRNKLFIVSKDFNKYTEDDIKNAYQEATHAQMRLILKREEEKSLIKARNDLEVRLKRNMQIAQKAENYMYKMKSVMDFLIGDLKNVSEKLSALEDKNQIGMNIIKAQEEERRKIVRDIHDGPAQSLASLVIRSEVLEKIMDKDITLLKEEIKDIKGIIRNTLKDIRKIMYDISPSSLDDLGLIPTIKRVISDIIYDKKINIEFVVLNNEKINNPLVKITVFRVIQECLNNICKHSRANNVLIKIDINKKNICAVVQDDGIGLEECEKLISKDSFGIRFMKERISLLDGKLDIQSKIGQGTKIIFIVPNKEVEYEN